MTNVEGISTIVYLLIPNFDAKYAFLPKPAPISNIFFPFNVPNIDFILNTKYKELTDLKDIIPLDVLIPSSLLNIFGKSILISNALSNASNICSKLIVIYLLTDSLFSGFGAFKIPII